MFEKYGRKTPAEREKMSHPERGFRTSFIENLFGLTHLRGFNRELSRLNDFLEANPQGFRDIIECWRDTNIILGRLVGLKVEYSDSATATPEASPPKKLRK